MSFFQDILAIFKKRELLFLESRKELEDVYTFVFEKDKDVTLYEKVNDGVIPKITTVCAATRN